jgi:hypothetical protein
MLREVKLYTLRKRKHLLSVLFLLRAYFGFEFYPSLLETVGHQDSALYIKDLGLFGVWSSSPLPDALLLLPLFSGTLTHLEPKVFFYIIFCSRTLFLLNIYCTQYGYMYIYSHRIMTGVIVLTEYLLLSKLHCFVSPFYVCLFPSLFVLITYINGLWVST